MNIFISPLDMFHVPFNPQKYSLGIVCTAMIAPCLEIQHCGNSNDKNNGTWQMQLQFAPLSAIYELYRDRDLS